MRKSLLLILCLVLASFTSFAQEDTSSVAIEEVDRYNNLKVSLSRVVSCSEAVSTAMDLQVEKNMHRAIMGYRIRIFFDNKQNARQISSQIVDSFKEKFPDVPTYRVYDNPYFKVTVGDFRSKSDAMRFMNVLKQYYPSVFLVRETFSTI